MTVWTELIGQEAVVAELSMIASSSGAVGGAAGRAAEHLNSEPAARTGMTHAWLFTGPAGSGRSNAALAFAAALQCSSGGCGTCRDCQAVRRRTHPDVIVVRPTLVSYGVDDARELVRRAGLAPVGPRWQVIVVEDADRLTDHAVNALLKAVEEPAPRTVWLLCAPTTEDVLPTLRSRCRHVRLRTPSTDAIARMLIDRDGIEPEVAESAARASQGHIGRARWLATDEAARARRAEVLALPPTLTGLDACLDAAARLIAAADADASAATEEVAQEETDELRRALGFGTQGKAPRGVEAALKDLESRQKRRSKREQRDSLDRGLSELLGFYRDVLATQLGGAPVVRDETSAEAVRDLAVASPPEATVRRMDAILACREALDANASTQLALESMTFALRAG